MNSFIKILLLYSSTLLFSSCSVFWGGLVAIDNASYKGPNEVNLKKLQKIKHGTKVILNLKDSTEITGLYEGFAQNDESESNEEAILIKDERNIQTQIKTSNVIKYTYIDEGGSVWTAAALGGIIDACIIYILIKGPAIGGSSIVLNLH